MLGNMFPVSSVDNGPGSGEGHTLFFSQSRSGFSIGDPLPDFYNFRLGEPCLKVFLAFREHALTTPIFVPVLHIEPMSSRPEMRGITADGVSAPRAIVDYVYSWGNRTICKFIGYAVSFFRKIIDTKLSVAVSVLASGPRPTFVRASNINLSPKSFCDWLSVVVSLDVFMGLTFNPSKSSNGLVGNRSGKSTPAGTQNYFTIGGNTGNITHTGISFQDSGHATGRANVAVAICRYFKYSTFTENMEVDRSI